MKFLLLHLATFGAGRLQEGPVANGSTEQRTLVGGKNGIPKGAKGGVCFSCCHHEVVLLTANPQGRSAIERRTIKAGPMAIRRTD
jgi:hypothetical protein